MRKMIAWLGAVVAVACAGVAFAVVNPLAGAGAANKHLDTGTPTPAAAAANPNRPHPVDDALAELVANKTITADQAAKVKAAIEAHTKSALAGRLNGGGLRPGAGRGLMGRPMVLKEAVKTAADTIGIAPKDLVAALRSGQSVADVAKAHNIDPQKVIDALVAKGDAAIDKAVANGKLKPARAATLKANLAARVAALVNRQGLHK